MRTDTTSDTARANEPMDAIEPLLRLLGGTWRPARRSGSGRAGTTTTQSLLHALQCAQAAERTGAPDALIAAALFHDIGHALDPDHAREGLDDLHEMRALPLLAQAFGPSVTEPVRLHVQAKRYLVSADLTYVAHLPDAALQSLARQGGPMSGEECRVFERLPYAEQAVALRRWDDDAHVPGAATPPLAHYRTLLKTLSRSRPLDRTMRNAVLFGT